MYNLMNGLISPTKSTNSNKIPKLREHAMVMVAKGYMFNGT